ncbi:MAG TPA: PPC domain-containing DNA-binding protein [Candidatus Kryptonia bacterium]
MKCAIMIFVIFISIAGAQQTKIEVSTPTAPGDSLPNSAAVPEVYAVENHFQRVEVVRLKFGSDLLKGLERIVGEEKIVNGVILSGIGSVRSYHFHCVSNRDFPSRNICVDNPASSADIACMNGYVIGGRVHAHILFSDSDKAFGGHLEPGTSVFTFAIVTIGVLSDTVDLSRLDDKTYR